MNDKDLNQGISVITRGFIKPVEIYNNLLVDPLLPQLYNEYSKVLIIYALYPNLSRITSYPLNSDDVWKISFLFKTEKPNLIKNEFSKIVKYRLIHTTGLCLKDEGYIVENYILSDSDLDISLELKKELDNMKGLTKYYIARVDNS